MHSSSSRTFCLLDRSLDRGKVHVRAQIRLPRRLKHVHEAVPLDGLQAVAHEPVLAVVDDQCGAAICRDPTGHVEGYLGGCRAHLHVFGGRALRRVRPLEPRGEAEGDGGGGSRGEDEAEGEAATGRGDNKRAVGSKEGRQA